jgi:selenide,water dikinase
VTDTTPKPRLTELAKTAGCAAKVAQIDLLAALRHLPRAQDPRLVVGPETGDDAAVLLLRDDLALVETVDIFTPIVDDPRDYGRIAAANALSDVYAMGATPLSALSFAAWPMDVLGPDMLGEVFQGAAAVCQQAGIAIAGGHSIVDAEPKFGLFVTGSAHPSEIVTNAGAQPGDVLVLTKPIGTGILVTAVKRGLLDPDALKPAIDAMTTLNRGAAAAMREARAHAATDVTGFGLLGHLGNVLRASSAQSGLDLGARLLANNVPLLDRVADFAANGTCPGGTRRNLEFAAPLTRFSEDLPDHVRLLLADAQTSGGLLIAVPPARLDTLLAALAHHDVETRAVIGEVLELDEPAEIAVL